MPVRSLFLMLTFLAILSATQFSTAEEGDELTRRIWQEIQGKPNPRLLDNFEVLEGFPLLVNGPDISPEATVLMAVFAYTAGPDWKAVRLSALDEAVRKAQAELDTLSEKEFLEAFNSFVQTQEWFKWIVAEGHEAQTRREDWKTELVRESYLFEIYMQQTGNLLAALEMFQEDHFLEAVVEQQDAVTWEKIKEAIDKKIPVILQNGRSSTVVVGYYVEGMKPFVLIYDPTEAEYEIRTGIDNVHKAARESLDPLDAVFVRQVMRMQIPSNFVLHSADGTPPGVSFAPFQSIDALNATFIYEWTADTDSCVAKFLEFLELRKGEQQ